MSNKIKFKAMGIMADKNQDIRLSNTVIECKNVKQGGLLTFGIDDGTRSLITKQMFTGQSTYIVVCLVINGDQLEAIEKELTEKEEQQWISVHEKLPTTGTNCLFVVDQPGSFYDNAVYAGKYTGTPESKHKYDRYSFSVPGTGFIASYWMPSPEAPKIP